MDDEKEDFNKKALDELLNDRPNAVEVTVKVVFLIPNGDEFIEDPKNYTTAGLCRMVENALFDIGMEEVKATPIKVQKHYD